jgi:hypothetical protein
MNNQQSFLKVRLSSPIKFGALSDPKPTRFGGNGKVSRNAIALFSKKPNLILHIFSDFFLLNLTHATVDGVRGDEAWRHDGGGSRHWYPGYYEYFSPFDYGLDDYTSPYYGDDDSLNVQPASNAVTPDASTSLIMSVQSELTRLATITVPSTASPVRRLNGQSAGFSQVITCR